MKNNLYILFGCISVFLCYACNKSAVTSYPEPLINAISLFYQENQNEKVLAELDKLSGLQSSDEIERMAVLFRTAALCESEKTDNASALFRSIQPILDNDRFMFWYNSIKGLILFRQDDLVNAYEALLNTINSRHKDIRALALNERILARISFLLSDQTKGIEWLTLSTKHFEQAGLEKGKAINLKSLGRFYMNNGSYTKALHTFKTAERIISKYDDKEETFYIYVGLIDYCLLTNQLPEARYYANKCLNLSKRISKNSFYSLAYNNMAEVDIKSNKNDEALEYLNKTLQLPSNYLAATIRQTYAHVKLSDIYLTKNMPFKVLQHLLIGSQSLPHSGYLELKQQTYYKLSKAYWAVNNLQSAYAALDTAKLFQDSTSNSLIKSIKDLYDTNIELTTATFNLQKSKASGHKHLTIAFITIIFLVITGIITSFLNRQLHKKNKVLISLVQKNIQLAEDERKLRQSQLEDNKRKNTRKASENNDKNLQLFELLTLWLETDKNFSRKDLTLDTVAKGLNTNREYLSRAISEQDIRFNDLINKYRVEEVIAIFSDPHNRSNKFNLAVIGNIAGFNSNSVFIDAFRKQTGMTPAQFRSNLNKQSDRRKF
ncbi:MAG: putative rane protein [Bacteroidetes bacterium]|nr:putative rane protein [Bacteroidota bacterium]